MTMALLIIFYYGILHAFGPDHLTAIANFSIGKSRRRTIMITIGFAIAHGLGLMVFAYILQQFAIPDEILGYGDVIASSVILGMGVFLLFMVFTHRINFHRHEHNGKQHVHIWFGKKHSHTSSNIKDSATMSSAVTMGVLMGIGGVRGMLITLAAVSQDVVNLWMVFSFALGVFLVFSVFGLMVAFINEKLLHSQASVNSVFGVAGLVSLGVGSTMLLG